MSNQGKRTISKPNDEDEDSLSTAMIVLMWVVGGLFVLFIVIALYKYGEYAFGDAIMPSTRIPTRYMGFQWVGRPSNNRTGTLISKEHWRYYKPE